MNKYKELKQEQFGWKLAEKKYFRQEKWTAYYFEHRTGAKYLHIDNDFNDKAIAIALKTCPSDHSGVAHILEHTVLTGSKKYPVRDPFFSMLKNSLQTFMNAFTAEDWTAYIFSSQYGDDLMNLLSVYLDAVYFPRLDYLNFLQEGWRLAYRNNKLSYEGVVYNEMKGAMSSPERLMQEYMKEGLFPQSLYRFNSGGRPSDIPKLSYEDFKEFHQAFYHPSNTLLYSFGPINPEKILRFTDQNAFKDFTRKKIQSNVKTEPRWRKPKRAVKYFAAQAGRENKAQMLCAWLINPAVDIEGVLLLELIGNLLIGEASSPLKKALLSSGLGTDLADGSGVSAEYKDTVFACGLKGVKSGQAGRVQALIDSELKKTVNCGFSQADIKAAFNRLKFKHQEIKNQPYPYGIKLWLDIIVPWRQGGKVMDSIGYREHFCQLEKRVAKKGYIEKKISELIINNLHRLNLEMRPDRSLLKKQMKKESDLLKRTEQKLSQSEKERISADNLELNKLQAKKDDLSCLPELPLSSLPRKIAEPRPRMIGQNIFAYAQETGGIAYVNLGFPLAGLQEREILLLPLLSYVLPQIGTKEQNYNEFIRAVNTHTGGIKIFPWVENGRNNKPAAYLFAKGKALNKEWPKLAGLLFELLAEADFSDADRLFQYAREAEAKMSSSVIEGGHHYALSLSARSLVLTKKLQEDLHGLKQINFLKEIIKKNDKQALALALAQLSKKIFCRRPYICLTAQKEKISLFVPDLKKAYSKGRVLNGYLAVDFMPDRFFEGYKTGTAASFVGASAKTIGIKHKDSAALMAATKLLSRNYIHNLVREQGGAYGGFANYDYYSGIINFGSYRDPHIRRTLKSFKEAVNRLVKEGVSQESLKSARLMVIADTNKPLTPAEKGEQAFYYRLIGLDRAARQGFRDKILGLREEEIVRAAKKYLLPAINNASVAVISSQEQLKAANRQKGEKKFVIKNI